MYKYMWTGNETHSLAGGLGADLRWQSGPALPRSSVPRAAGGECAGVMGVGVRGDGVR